MLFWLLSWALGRFSLRDLFKWCKRITSFGFCFDGSLSEEQCNFIYTKEVDVFAEFPASFDNRLSIMKVIGNIWKARFCHRFKNRSNFPPIQKGTVT
ncbi:hypothetical protein P8452_76516 [Trifolium repens]|nr:midasin protein [Trifolium repens]KAK2397445.1 midasin protein [Trifolium repens]WJX29821.1 hypothetical protein P8452_18423 [Trifolium repens]WJX95167.1 hypothetical protein P8452_76516 [Trifolium repens]